ncbi:MAG: glycosyl hydrolase [Bryobacteraceae bacterium]|nr:glycosyl hydrolase [Bryobacteraceae bacterium]
MRMFVTCLCLFSAAFAAEPPKPAWTELKYRLVGPFRGGRVTAVAGVPGQRDVYYFGATGGGVFKTTDGGDTWIPVTDPYLKTGSVGAIGVSASNPNVLYVGMGESPIRGNVSHGDGVYKSTDAGKTWKHVGLGDSRHISRVRVHPKNPDVAWAAVLGHIFGPNEERGIFKTTDGGKTWKRILFKSAQTGAIDLAADASNPDVLYASFWQVKRTPWSLESGGPESGIWKSTDGGETWSDLTRNAGLPKTILGKIGITVSPVNPERVWAIIEAEDKDGNGGGVFRSDDGGATWRRTNTDRNLRQRAWYYSRIYADTQNLDRVYVLNVGFWRSDDGGATFRTLATPHGDNHDLWIDPENNARMIEGNDGGANVSTDGGRRWTAQDQATAQFYRVALDNDFPYNIYGAQQDNSTIRIASRSAGSGITERHWWDVGGGESGWIAPHPKDSNVVFAGSYGGYLTRYDHRTGQTRAINVWPDNPMGCGAESMKYRFQWNFPILFSPHDPNRLYTAGNMLFLSTNEGQSWTPISPDLTRNDKSKLGPSGGPITKDNTGVEYYGTIFTVAESPLKAGLIWAGSDDGLVHVTSDNGKSWTNVTPKPPAMPEWIQINSIEASPHDPGKAYFAATMYKHDDFRPYLYRTSDGGKSWTRIVNGIPDGAFTRVVREDPRVAGLLYAGTETGMYVSFDDGANWQPLQLNLPAVPITDLALHKEMNDLVVATKGRSFYVLDDLSVIQSYAGSSRPQGDHFFPVEPAYRTTGFRVPATPGDTFGENPPSGAVFHFLVSQEPKGEATLEIADLATKKTVRKFSTKQQGEGEPQPQGRRAGPAGARFTVKQGFNRFEWDLRHEDAKSFPGLILWAGSTRGPRATPGRYQARLTVNGATLTSDFEVRKDPRLKTTQEEFDQQLALLLQIRDKLTETHEAIIRIREVKRQLDDWSSKHKELEHQAKEISKKLTAVEEELYQTRLRSSQDPLNYPIKLNNKLAALASIAGSADAAPTAQSYQLHEELTSKINVQLKLLKSTLDTDLAAFNKSFHEKNLAAVK